MVRLNTFEETNLLASNALCELINRCQENQVHPQDLLICQQHGTLFKIDGRERAIIGPGKDGLASSTHLSFIKNEIGKFIVSNDNYFVSLSDDDVRVLEHTIHVEKLLYLKIWENVYFLKLLTQFSRLASGEAYDWQLEIPFERGNTKSDHIRNSIRDKVKDISPLFYQLIKESYSQQVRNAIAHSQYYFIQNGIYYSNYKIDKFALLKAIGYTDWEQKFSKTISLFLVLEKYLGEIHSRYARKTLEQGNQIEVLIPDDNSNAYVLLEYVEGGKRWVFK
ncbi:MAG: hypothetical protein J7599_07875 [Niabella sp.]|nr:hypothetical protein [Niabella sp.]